MRRLLAAIVAVAMLFGGYVVYLIRTDSELPWESVSTSSVTNPDNPSGSSSIMQFNVSCVPETEDGCASADNVGQSAFTIETPSSTEKAFGDNSPKAPDAWLTTTLGFERIRFVRPDLKIAGHVASTRIMVVTKTGATNVAVSCAGKLACVANAGRVSFPAVDTGAGLWVATATVDTLIGPGEDPATIDDVEGASDVIQGIRTSKKSSPVEALSNLVTLRLLDAVVTTESAVRSIGPTGVELTPADTTPVPYVLVISKSVNSSQAKQLLTSLRASLGANGFDAPVTDLPLPTPGLANEINQRLR